jgi:hypothetical protein
MLFAPSKRDFLPVHVRFAQRQHEAANKMIFTQLSRSRCTSASA